MAENGGTRIELIDMIKSDNIVVMEFKAFYNQRARNPRHHQRELIVFYTKCPADIRDLLKELVRNLDHSENLWKFAFVGQNSNNLDSFEEYMKEPKDKVISTMSIQLNEISSKSQATIFSDKDSTIKEDERFDVFTKKKSYIFGTEQVIKLKRGQTKFVEEIIKIIKEVRDIMKNGACIIGSTDIQCEDKKGSLNNKTTVSGIMYVDDGGICKNISCPASENQHERNCTNGTLTGPEEWCGKAAMPTTAAPPTTTMSPCLTDHCTLSAGEKAEEFRSHEGGGNYSANMARTWIISAPRNMKIELIFVKFHLEFQSICAHDSVIVFDGANDTATELGTYCGEIKDKFKYWSIKTKLSIKFKTDGAKQFPGFTASYRAVDPEGTLSAGQEAEVFQSHEGGGNYPFNLARTWIISAPHNMKIELIFVKFHLEFQSHCTKDYVGVYDGGSNAPGTGLGTYCGKKSNLHMNSTGSKLYIEFVSDFEVAAPGFRASYRAVP